MTAAPKIIISSAGTLVTVEYRGHITAADLRSHTAEVEALDRKVQPGFTVLTDLTALESMDLDCAPILSRIMELFNRLGTTRVVRVIPDPRKDIGLGILSLFHYKSGVAVNTVTTRAEAAHLVD
jgi:hypothetical protein